MNRNNFIGYVWVILTLLQAPFCSGQNYPTDYFILPVEHGFRCSGSFGELRNNHFHMGVDIKSRRGVNGDEILASADGYISRISISGGGYGNVLYIDHPNGYRSVYAHLSRFMPPVAEYVKAQQYEHHTFESTIYPPPTKIPVKQGEVIGYMGNSGRSFGPHLHFEIRESATDTPINPMLFGIKPKDTRIPILKNLKVIECDSLGVNNKTSFYPIRKINDVYVLEADTIYCSSDSIRLAIETYDKMNGAANKNGVYRVKMKVDQDPALDFIMHKIAFNHSDYFNAHIDYYEWKNADKFFTNLYKLKRNPIPIYNQKVQQVEGIGMTQHQARQIEINVSDIEKNETQLAFVIQRKDTSSAKSIVAGNYIIQPDRAQWISQQRWVFQLDSLAVLETQQIRIDVPSDTLWTSSNLKIGNEDHHLFQPIQVYSQNLHTDKILWDKQCLIRCDGEDTINYGGIVNDSLFTASISSFGTYETYIDTIPPVIKNVNLSENMKGRSNIRFTVTEEMKAASKSLRFYYNAWIDNEWVLMEYDQKNDRLTHYFDTTLDPGQHDFRLVVTDWAGNMAVYTRAFVR